MMMMKKNQNSDAKKYKRPIFIDILYVFGFQGVADKLRAFCFLYAGRHSALQGTPENPIPRDFFGKIKWYKKRFFGLYLLYLAMVNNYRVERERKKKNGSGGGPT